MASYIQDPTAGPRITHEVYRYEPGEAAVQFDAVIDATQKCPNDKRGKSKLEAGGLAFPNVGDETAATRITVTDQFGNVSIVDRVRWYRGDIMMVVGYFGFSPDLNMLRKYVRKADAKLQELYA
jgi:hypothetical protein